MSLMKRRHAQIHDAFAALRAGTDRRAPALITSGRRAIYADLDVHAERVEPGRPGGHLAALGLTEA
jgi:hypothetical protein